MPQIQHPSEICDLRSENRLVWEHQPFEFWPLGGERYATRESGHNTHRSICYDDTSGGDALDNRELKDVLAQACTVIGKKIDLIAEIRKGLAGMVEIRAGEPDDRFAATGSPLRQKVPFPFPALADFAALRLPKPGVIAAVAVTCGHGNGCFLCWCSGTRQTRAAP